MQENQNCVAVQGTNDSSIVSKSSMVRFDYYDDPFLQYVVEKTCRRSPLIHRGYYIRAMVMDHCFRKFLQKYGDTEFQIISFGAGFDSSYFRLKSCGLLKNGIYIEFDFPDVMIRKKRLVKDRHELAMLLSTEASHTHKSIVTKTEDYMMLGVDLTDLSELTNIVKEAGINTDIPTLLLSEVAITYMPVASSTQLIHWSGQMFSSATFLLYEQLRPNDGFGHVMQNHFNKLSCPLLALNDFPTMESQCERFEAAGWTTTKACDMNHFFLHEVSAPERTRVECLEPFDEYEEWHLKCAHYMILCAFNGGCSELTQEILPSVSVFKGSNTSGSGSSPSSQLTWQENDSVRCAMYGHTVTLLGDKIFCIGGFGLRETQAHGRLQSVTILRRDPWSSSVQAVCNAENIPVKFERMYHTASRISDSKILLIGGRTSPKAPCCLLTVLEIQKQVSGECQSGGADSNLVSPQEDMPCLSIKLQDISSQHSPLQRWRHSATCTELTGRLKCFIYGGKGPNGVFDDLWQLDIENMMWTQLNPTGKRPGSRHSHTSVWSNTKFYVACGLGIDTAYGDVVSYHPETNSWEDLPINGQLNPRYSHTSSVWDGWLLLLGGVSLDGSNPGVARINLSTGVCMSHALPEQSPAAPIMLHSHASMQLTSNKLLVLGGGGNCFSFGTHLNKNPIQVLFQD